MYSTSTIQQSFTYITVCTVYDTAKEQINLKNEDKRKLVLDMEQLPV